MEAAAAASKQARSRREESGGIDERQACVCVRVTARSARGSVADANEEHVCGARADGIRVHEVRCDVRVCDGVVYGGAATGCVMLGYFEYLCRRVSSVRRPDTERASVHVNNEVDWRTRKEMMLGARRVLALLVLAMLPLATCWGDEESAMTLVEKAQAAAAAAAEATAKAAKENLPELKRQAAIMSDKAAAAAEAAAQATKEAAVESAPMWQKLGSDVADVSSAATAKAATALESGMSSGMRALMAFFDISKETLKNILTGLANLAFCLVMLLGFIYLPPDVMLVVGGITFFIGPALVLLLFWLIGELVSSAATAPIFFILLLFVLTLFRSHAGKRLAIKMGLDSTGDGKIGAKDLVAALKRASPYKACVGWLDNTGWVKLDDVEAALDKVGDTDPKSFEGLHERMLAIEGYLKLIVESKKLKA